MKKDLLILLLILLPAIAWLVQPGYFSMHDDLQAVRQMEMARCFADGQIPCRWVLDLGYGFGYPLFNYYPPLPYLIGLPFHWLGLQYVDVVKAVGILGFGFCAWGMYLLAREFFGTRGGLLASVVYTYAPYHSVDFYVRGAMNEFWAMAFFPLIFYTSYKLISSRDRRGKWIISLSLSFAGLMLSHNLMLMVFTPVLLVWCIYWLWNLRGWPAFRYLVLSALWSVGLAAFFTLPVVFESRFAHVETLTIGYFNFLAHFLDLRQIFFRINWGYGESVYGSGDTMSFALGYLQWILPLIVLLSMFFVKKIKSYKYLILLLLLFTFASLYMSHYKSTPLWLRFPPLQFLQFPWRFLTLAVFSASLISGAVVLIHKKLLPLLLLLLLLLNANYFRPRAWYPDMTDADKFSGKSWQWQVTGSIFDYLPVYAPLPPADPAGGDLGITSGEGTYTTLEKKSNLQRYSIDIASDRAVVEIQTFYFPGWQVYLDGRRMAVDPARDPLLGRMQVEVPYGTHTITARFTNTPIRTIADSLSLLAWIAVPVYLFIYRRCWRESAFILSNPADS